MLSQLGHARARSGTALDRLAIFNLLRMAGKIPTSAMSFGYMPILVRRTGPGGLPDPLIGLGLYAWRVSPNSLCECLVPGSANAFCFLVARTRGEAGSCQLTL